MSLVELPAATERVAVYGDDFVWFPDDSEERRYNPVTDIRISRRDDPQFTPEWMEAVVEHAAEALSMLSRLDPTEMDADTARAWATGVEQLRRQADAAANAVAAHVDTAEPFAADGWFTAKRWMKHTLQLSGPESYARVQTARFLRRVPLWATAEGAGQVGVAQVRLMASIAANPRIDDDTLAWGARQLLIDAMDVSFEEFERLARTWELLADPVGSAETAERNRQRRDASLHPRPEGGWDLHATLDDVAGVELQEILAWYIDAEHRSDWAEAVERLGDGNVSMVDLRRTEPQRRADALVAMARAAAAAPPDAKRPVPTVGIVVDADTMAAWSGAPVAAATDDHSAVEPSQGPRIDPDRYHDVVCRTEHGHRLHPSDAVNTSLWAFIRRVVIDSRGVVIDLGRRSRLFSGGSREAVMLLEPSCVWTGCDLPTRWCHADHNRQWSARGPTRPDNGAPLCPRHNYFKEQGFTVTRDEHGDWHVHAPDGHEVT